MSSDGVPSGAQRLEVLRPYPPASSTLTSVVDSWTETTLVSALLYYGLACADGTHCVDALRKIGHDKAADVLADALAERHA